ncbi:MAG: hypothetical protein WBX00_17325 [Isosphaeraceae bacterium]
MIPVVRSQVLLVLCERWEWGVAPRPDDQGLASEEGSPSEHATGGRN